MNVDKILRKTFAGYESTRQTACFNRRALNAKLLGRGVFSSAVAAYNQTQPTAREIGNEPTQKDISYLIRFPYESDTAYAQRFALAIDGGESHRVLSEIIGHILRPGYTLNLDGFSDEIKKQIENNFDGQGTSFDNFLTDIVFEIAGIGRGLFITTSDETTGLPRTKVILRENLRDISRIGDAIEYVIYEDCYAIGQGIDREEKDAIVYIDSAAWIYIDKKTKAVLLQSENPLGFVPVVDVWHGSEALSIVETICRLQYLILNAESVLAQKIRNQAMNILNGPTGIASQLRTLSTNKVIEIPPDSSRGLEWAAYPSAGLDGDFKYMQLLVERLFQAAASRNINNDSAQSGVSKSWDFLSQRALLETIANETESAIDKILAQWSHFLGQTPRDRFALNKTYDVQTLAETLQNVFQAMSLQLGATVDRKLKVAARDSLQALGVTLTDAERAQSDAELADADELRANISTLLAGEKIKTNEVNE